MGLRSNEIIEILKKLIGGEIKKTPLGEGLIVSARDAFLFSAITGAAYFENQIYPYTPKGLLKIFYNALDYNFVTGIFDNLSLRNTPYYITENRTYLKTGLKVIVPVEIDSEWQFRTKIKELYPNNASDHNILILKVDTSKKGYGLEPLMEYLVCKFFTRKGYITENQIPLSHALGSPDFGGFAIDEIQTSIINNGVLPSGFNIIELSMIRAFPQTPRYLAAQNNLSNFLVGEAKTSSTIMDPQIRKYLKSGYFDQGLEIHPSKVNATNPDIGMFSLNNNDIVYIEPKNQHSFSQSERKKIYKDWLKSYFNCYLISNYTNDELKALSIKLLGKKLESRDDLINLIKNFGFSTHLEILTGFIKNGII